MKFRNVEAVAAWRLRAMLGVECLVFSEEGRT